MIQYSTRLDGVLRDRIATNKNIATYMSPTTQNELLDLASNQILKSTVTDYNNADCFTFIADESTDISIKEQIACNMCPICVQESRR